jgi:hypothetical protein
VGAGAVGIDAAQRNIVDVRGCQFAHVEAIGHARQSAVLLVGRVACRHKIDLIQRQLKMGLFGKDQMADVDGVEGSSKDSDAFAIFVYHMPIF